MSSDEVERLEQIDRQELVDDIATEVKKELRAIKSWTIATYVVALMALSLGLLSIAEAQVTVTRTAADEARVGVVMRRIQDVGETARVLSYSRNPVLYVANETGVDEVRELLAVKCRNLEVYPLSAIRVPFGKTRYTKRINRPKILRGRMGQYVTHAKSLRDYSLNDAVALGNEVVVVGRINGGPFNFLRYYKHIVAAQYKFAGSGSLNTTYLSDGCNG